jgi:hypothetical protein
MKYFFILLISVMIMAEGCRPPRCPLPNCYVRMKHRHGGENWKAAAAPSDFDPDRNPNANRGKEFRGVPWWKKNKNPKIGDGYKPGYKYDYRKPKSKKQRKKKKLPEEQVPATEEQITEDGQPQEEGEISEQTEQAPQESSTAEEPKKKKGLFKKGEKKEKQKEAEKPLIEEAQPEKKQEEETDGF